MAELLLVIAFLALVDFCLLTYIMHQRVVIKRLSRLPASAPIRVARQVLTPRERELAPRVDPIDSDCQSALLNLGYTRVEAVAAVAGARLSLRQDHGSKPDLDTLLRRCLAQNAVVARH
jgi:hypothetical protein